MRGLFAGEASQIKEYSVGVEVFHRGASFDQDADSIVRVEANRLRKRLAEYYAGEGASHRLHITIPLGQYVPEFESSASRQRRSSAGRPGIENCRNRAVSTAGFVCPATGVGGLSPHLRFCFSASIMPC
jgi:hypothetical protein